MTKIEFTRRAKIAWPTAADDYLDMAWEAVRNHPRLAAILARVLETCDYRPAIADWHKARRWVAENPDFSKQSQARTGIQHDPAAFSHHEEQCVTSARLEIAKSSPEELTASGVASLAAEVVAWYESIIPGAIKRGLLSSWSPKKELEAQIPFAWAHLVDGHFLWLSSPIKPRRQITCDACLAQLRVETADWPSTWPPTRGVTT